MQFWSLDIEKQVGARVQTVLDSPELFSIYQHFGAETLRRSSVFHGLEAFLRSQKIVGDRCFEIGTWNGLTAVILSRFFREVVSVDIAHNEMKHDVLRHLGITNVRCVDIDSNDEKRRIADGLKFDFAYLDGNHADDTEADWQMSKKCGRVLFHEVWPFQDQVFRLVHSLPPYQVEHNGMGLALWDGSGVR